MSLDRLTRETDRERTDRAALDTLLDEVLVGTLSAVSDGEPWSLPIFFARDGDRVLFHGSTGAGLLRHLAAGAPATFTVFSLDGIVVAHTAFESSANYRSAVLRGRLAVLDGAEAARALDVLTDRLIPGRTTEVRGTNRRERAATVVLALPITAWLAKERTGEAGLPDEATDAWAGVVPLRLVAGEPVTDSWVPGDRPVPPSVHALLMRHR